MSVFTFEDQDIITIETGDLKKLKESAQESELLRSRYCLHHDNEAQVHEMIIAFCIDTYVRPHRHINKTESFHVIEGELNIVFFDDNGNITRVLNMKPIGSDGPFVYRLANEQWHMVIPLIDETIIHEVTCGPFIKDESVFAPWSPEQDDKEGVAQFLDKIKGVCREQWVD